MASMGGIAGTQTVTLIVRGLALGQVSWANARWLVLKEITVALLKYKGVHKWPFEITQSFY